MEPTDVLETRLSETLDVIEEIIQQDAASLKELEKSLDGIEEQVLQTEGGLVGQDKEALTRELEKLNGQKLQLQAILEEAHALGLPQIQSETQMLKEEQEDLKSQDFEAAREVLTGLDSQAQSLITARQQAEDDCKNYQASLERLQGEQTNLAQLEKSVGSALKEWKERERPRQLRQECMDTARKIHKLRESLRQKIIDTERTEEAAYV